MALLYTFDILWLMESFMSTGTVFINNRTQAVRLPADSRFPQDVKKVAVRVVGKDRILSPVDQSWDSFFLSDASVTDDFMTERASQEQAERESF
jgi:antitoxin VapB